MDKAITKAYVTESLQLLDCDIDDFGKIVDRSVVVGLLEPEMPKSGLGVLAAVAELMRKLQYDVNQHGTVLPINWRKHEKIVVVLLTRKMSICESVRGEDRCELQIDHKGKHSFGGNVWTTDGAALFNKGRERLTA